MRFWGGLRGVAGAALLIAVLAAPGSAAAAGTVTREQYVERAEAICKERSLANRGVLDGVEDMVQAGQLKPAGAKVLRASSALSAAIAQLAAVPRPPAAAGQLAGWLGHARDGERLLERIGNRLSGGSRRQVESMAKELLRESKQANAAAIGFGFKYCRLSAARYG